MVDMKKQFPSQVQNRKQWCLDAVRANQDVVGDILIHLVSDPSMIKRTLKRRFNDLHRGDRDALTIDEGIFTPEQIKILTGE